MVRTYIYKGNLSANDKVGLLNAIEKIKVVNRDQNKFVVNGHYLN